MNAIQMNNITKSFHGSYANNHITFCVKKGEIHSLLGENGAGKTTLMKILFGLYKPDEGEIFIDEEKVNIHSSFDAIHHGLSMVHQHFVLVENLTVTDNIILGNEPKKGLFLNRIMAEKKVNELIAKYHFGLHADAMIEDLSVGERQKVEILKALYNDASILLLDEPTAVLTPQEVDDFFRMLRDLKAEGKTIVIITHKLKETLAIADQITILQKGENAGTMETKDANEAILAKRMVGRPIDFSVTRKPLQEQPALKLSLSDVTVKKKGRTLLNHVNLKCHAGEIVGIAGVEGNGQSELIDVITGIINKYEGTISCGGEQIRHSNPKKMLKYLSHIPEERGKKGYVKTFKNWENMILGYQDREAYQNGVFLNSKEIRQKAQQAMEVYDVRADGIDQLTDSLSGGNQQKLIIGRALMHNHDIVIAAQPTRGVDIGAIEYIHKQLIAIRDEGSCILLLSADLDEVMKLSDRIAVLYEGKIVCDKAVEEYTKNELGVYMMGGNKKEVQTYEEKKE